MFPTRGSRRHRVGIAMASSCEKGCAKVERSPHVVMALAYCREVILGFGGSAAAADRGALFARGATLHAGSSDALGGVPRREEFRGRPARSPPRPMFTLWERGRGRTRPADSLVLPNIVYPVLFSIIRLVIVSSLCLIFVASIQFPLFRPLFSSHLSASPSPSLPAHPLSWPLLCLGASLPPSFLQPSFPSPCLARLASAAGNLVVAFAFLLGLGVASIYKVIPPRCFFCARRMFVAACATGAFTPRRCPLSRGTVSFVGSPITGRAVHCPDLVRRVLLFHVRVSFISFHFI